MKIGNNEIFTHHISMTARIVAGAGIEMDVLDCFTMDAPSSVRAVVIFT
jgi:hypothetical protein